MDTRLPASRPPYPRCPLCVEAMTSSPRSILLSELGKKTLGVVAVLALGQRAGPYGPTPSDPASGGSCPLGQADHPTSDDGAHRAAGYRIGLMSLPRISLAISGVSPFS
jgi:hypothetical protein